MQPDLNRGIEQVSKEKGIDKGISIAALEEAMLSAARRTFGLEHQIEAKFNSDIGEVELFEIKIVVDEITDPTNQVTVKVAKETLDPEAEVGDELLSKLSQDKFGRIAAQAAKQNIIQKVREAERTIIFNEFKDRKGELFSGIVSAERKGIIVNLGRTDAILPEKEQIPRERYRQGDPFAFILDVELTSKGPDVEPIPPLIKLFEQGCQRSEGIVEVKGAARSRADAQIAVYSNDRDVDPVGACVSMRGTRVQSVVQELRGEKIDIVPWIQDQPEYVCRALSPRSPRSSWTRTSARWKVIVPDDQLSLAIGKKGQNVRLASRLTGWRLDVKGEAEAEEEARNARQSLVAIPGIGDVTAELLYQDGFKSAEELALADVDRMGQVEGVSSEKAAGIIKSAQAHVEQKRIEAEARAVADRSGRAAALELPRLSQPPRASPRSSGCGDDEA
jgi:N utilization substance protein A